MLYLLSVRLCLPVAELCLLLSRGSGCRTPAWMWPISSPPTVSYTSSARYGRRGVCGAPPRPRGAGVLTGSVLCQVLLPPRGSVPQGQGLLQQLDLVPAFRLFRELLQVRRGEKGREGGLEGGGWLRGRVPG